VDPILSMMMESIRENISGDFEGNSVGGAI
jgi:hypothetical protein